MAEQQSTLKNNQNTHFPVLFAHTKLGYNSLKQVLRFYCKGRTQNMENSSFHKVNTLFVANQQ